MDARDVDLFNEGKRDLVAGTLDEDHEQRLKGKEAMQKALGRRKPIEEFNLQSADIDCTKCNGTGIVKHTRLYATSKIITVVCDCVTHTAD